MKQFIVLEGLREGNRFYTSNSGKPESEVVKLNDGTVAYKILGFADTGDEAREIIRSGRHESNAEMVADYLFRTGRGLFSKDYCDRMGKILTMEE